MSEFFQDEAEGQERLRMLAANIDCLLSRLGREPYSEAKRAALTRIWDRLREMRDDDGTDTE